MNSPFFARTVASTGATLSASVAAGIMAINKHHGGAIEDSARYLAGLLRRAGEEEKSIDEIAAAKPFYPADVGDDAGEHPVRLRFHDIICQSVFAPPGMRWRGACSPKGNQGVRNDDQNSGSYSPDHSPRQRQFRPVSSG